MKKRAPHGTRFWFQPIYCSRPDGWSLTRFLFALTILA
jgi:hypothetical protein